MTFAPPIPIDKRCFVYCGPDRCDCMAGRLLDDSFDIFGSATRRSEVTVSVKISVNGNYKLPVTYKQGEREESITISGRGHSGPNEQSIPFYHGADVMTLQLGPETPDNGDEAEAA